MKILILASLVLWCGVSCRPSNNFIETSNANPNIKTYHAYPYVKKALTKKASQLKKIAKEGLSVVRSPTPEEEIVTSPTPEIETVTSPITENEIMTSPTPETKTVTSPTPEEEIVTSFPETENVTPSIPETEIVTSSIPETEIVTSSIPETENVVSPIEIPSEKQEKTEVKTESFAPDNKPITVFSESPNRIFPIEIISNPLLPEVEYQPPAVPAIEDMIKVKGVPSEAFEPMVEGSQTKLIIETPKSELELLVEPEKTQFEENIAGVPLLHIEPMVEITQDKFEPIPELSLVELEPQNEETVPEIENDLEIIPLEENIEVPGLEIVPVDEETFDKEAGKEISEAELRQIISASGVAREEIIPREEIVPVENVNVSGLEIVPVDEETFNAEAGKEISESQLKQIISGSETVQEIIPVEKNIGVPSLEIVTVDEETFDAEAAQEISESQLRQIISGLEAVQEDIPIEFVDEEATNSETKINDKKTKLLHEDDLITSNNDIIEPLIPEEENDIKIIQSAIIQEIPDHVDTDQDSIDNVETEDIIDVD